MTKEEIIKAVWNHSVDRTPDCTPDRTLQKAKLAYENVMNLIRKALARGRTSLQV